MRPEPGCCLQQLVAARSQPDLAVAPATRDVRHVQRPAGGDLGEGPVEQAESLGRLATRPGYLDGVAPKSEAGGRARGIVHHVRRPDRRTGSADERQHGQ